MHRTLTVTTCFRLLGCTLFLCACNPHQANPPTPLSDVARLEIYSRAEVNFATAILFKPNPHDSNTNAVQFAPFLVWEVSTNAPMLSTSTNLTVLFRDESTDVRGEARRQFSYFWMRPTASGDAREWQGLRLTLNGGGQPVIWETFGERSGAQITFVAQSLESIAQATFGPPLAGRRYSVEPGIAAEPAVVVARVIDDGPAPMGPIIHLRADGEVATVICRCMPPQFQQLTAEWVYNLAPWSEGGLPNNFPPPARLEHQLRLPP